MKLEAVEGRGGVCVRIQKMLLVGLARTTFHRFVGTFNLDTNLRCYCVRVCVWCSKRNRLPLFDTSPLLLLFRTIRAVNFKRQRFNATYVTEDPSSKKLSFQYQILLSCEPPSDRRSFTPGYPVQPTCLPIRETILLFFFYLLLLLLESSED